MHFRVAADGKHSKCMFIIPLSFVRVVQQMQLNTLADEKHDKH